MERTKGIFQPTQANLEVIKQSQAMAENADRRFIPCRNCNHKTIVLYQRTTTPFYVAIKCDKCKTQAIYNLADYRRGISLRTLLRSRS